MANIGEAFVDVHATTDKVRNEVRDGVNKGMDGVGGEAGKKFTNEFDRETSSGLSGVAARLGNRISSVIGTAGSDAGRSFADRFRSAAAVISGTKIEAPDLDTAKIQAQIQAVAARLDKLNGMKASATVEANIAVAMVNLQRLEAKLADINGKKVDIPFDKNFDKSITQSLISVSALARAIGTLALPVAVIGATPAIASLGASAVQVTGLLYLLPAATAVAALGIGTLVTGFSNLGDALGPTGTPAQLKKQQEAMAALDPQARATALAIRAQADEWTKLRQTVQGRMFQGISDDVQPLATTYLPMLGAAMNMVASGFNRGAQEMIGFLRSNAGITDMRTAINNTAIATTSLTGALAPLGRAILDIFVVGSGYLREYAGGITNLAVQFENWISKARATGELNRIIEQAIVVAGQLVDVVSNLGGIFYTIFQAGQTGAGNFLQVLVLVTGEINKFLKSPEGNDALVALFRTIHDTVAALLPGMLALGAAIAKSIIILGPILPQIGEAFSALMISAAPFIEAMARFAAFILPPVISLIQQLAPVLGPAIAAFTALYTATSILGGVITVFKSINDVVRIATVAKTAYTAATWLATTAMTALTSPVGLVVVAIAALAAGLIYAYQNSETFRNIVDGAMRAVGAAVASVIEWFRQLPDRIRDAVTAAGQWFNGLYDSAVATGVRIGQWISSLPSMISEGITALGATIASAARTAWEWLVTEATASGQRMIAFLTNLPGDLAYAFGFIAGAIARGSIDAFVGLVNGAVAGWNATYAFILSIPERVGNFFTALGTTIYNSGLAAWNRLNEAWDNAYASTAAFLASIPERLVTFAVALGVSLFTAGASAWTRFNDAVQAGIEAAVRFFETLPGRVGGALVALGIALYDSAANGMNQFIAAVQSGIESAVAFFQSVPGRIGAVFSAAGSWLYQAGADILNGLVNGLVAGANAVWTWLTDLTNRFIQGFKDAFAISSPSALFAQFGTWILEGFLNGLTAMVATIMGFVTTFISNFISGFDNMQTMFIAIWQAIQTATVQILTAVVAFVTTQVQNILSFITNTMNAVLTFWTNVWNAVATFTQTILSAIYTFVSQQIQNLFNFISTTMNALSAFWQSIWNAISAFGQAIWNALYAFYQSGFTNWRVLFETILNAMNAFWQSIWTAIRVFGEQIWNAIYAFFQTGFNNFRTLVETVMNAISAFWQQIWTAIRTFAEQVWNAFYQFIQNGLNALRTLIDNVMNAISAAWTTVWNVIRTAGETAWRNFQTFITSGLQTFKAGWDSFWNGITTGFSSIWQGIQSVAQTAWTNLNNNFRGGINLVIDAVNWPINKINDVFGISIPTIARLATGGTVDVEGLATGGSRRPGRVSGIGGRTADRVPTMLSPDEHVWSASEVNAAGGHDAVRRMRAQVMAGMPEANEPGNLARAMSAANVKPDSLGRNVRQGFERRKLMDKYPNMDDLGRGMLAYGGVMAHVAAAGDEVTRVFGAMPGGIGGVGARPNASDHPGGLALDFMTMNNLGLGDRVADYLYQNAAKLSLKYEIFKQRIRNPGGGWAGMADRGSVTANHFDHVHASFMAQAGQVGTDSGGGLGGLVARIMPSFDGILEGGKSALKGMLGDRPAWWGDLGGSFLDKAWEGMKSKATDAWNALGVGVQNVVSSITGGGAAPAGQVNDWIIAALDLAGMPHSYAAGIYQQIMTESGGNPNAVQHGYTDVNTLSGNLARGIMQVIPPTFAANAVAGHNNIMNPVDNIAAGARYALKRYGADWFSTGAQHTHGYDTGGWLEPGVTTAINGTGKREAVIADPMTIFERSFRTVFRWLAPQIEGALESGNTSAFNNLINRLGGEREVGTEIARAYSRMPGWAQELVQTQFPALVAAIRSPQVDVVDTIRALIPVVKPVVTAPVPVIPPVEVPKVVVPQLPVGDLGLSFQDALRQFAPELSLALKAGAGDQSRYLVQEILGNNERLAALSDAMGTDITPILTQLANSLKLPPPPIPPIVIPQPTWLQTELGRVISYATTNATRSSSAGDRIDDLSDSLERAFYTAFPDIKRATETSRIDVNKTLAADASALLSFLQTRSTAEQVQILEALDGRDRSLTDALKAAQDAVKPAPVTTTPPSMTIADGAFQVTIAGNADSVTVDQLRDTLVAWSDEILHQYEGRT